MYCAAADDNEISEHTHKTKYTLFYCFSLWIFTPQKFKWNPWRPSQGDLYMSVYVSSVWRSVEMERLYWLFFSHHDWIIVNHPTEKQRERGQPICAFIMWLFGATVRTTDGLRGPISLSIHSFIGLRWFPPSRPLRGPHLITDHHSHLACVPFQLSAQFLSDDPREPQAHWPRLE